MRGKDTTGRFSVPFELREISKGIENDNEMPLYQYIDWWHFSSQDSNIDPVYDVGDYDGGRVWDDPVRLMVVRQSVQQGPVPPNERGFYASDDMTFIVNESEFRRKLPNVAYKPDLFLNDRIVWRDEIFHPLLINPRCHIWNTAVTVMIQASQVNPEELINDPQFNWVFEKNKKLNEFEGTDITGTVNKPELPKDKKWSPPLESEVVDDIYGTS